MKTKTCSTCHKKQSIKNFNKANHHKDGLTSQCKACIKLNSQKWYKNNLNHVRITYKKNLKQIRNRNLKKKFGITLINYNTMLENQNYVCAICNQPEKRVHNNGKISALCVDHDHQTGKIRGLLCYGCNVSLGRFKDNPELLKRALKYISS